jgi:aryl-alcohol dehydrogenase-like predicted oxidoreductase
MKKFTRREFIKTSLTGTMVAGSGLILNSAQLYAGENKISLINLGKSGVSVSRIALGTGSDGWRRESDQTRLGMKKFIELAEYVYDRGIIFFDLADAYGSHTYLREALKIIPREKVVIMSKIWIREADWKTDESIPLAIDRFRKEIGTDYLDIVLIHCMVSPNWLEEQKEQRDDLSEAKQRGIIRAHGVSCHDFGALKTAAGSDWVEILLARINHRGAKMDGPPEKVMPLLKQAHDRGAGVIGMKIFGCGDLINVNERQKSLEYVWDSGNVDAMTIGIENKAQVNDNISRVSRILNN